MIELLSHAITKSQVKLQLNVHRMQLQQEQFVGLLDTVPDMVLISQQTESAKSDGQVIYANRKMKEFFGEELRLNSDVQEDGKPMRKKNPGKGGMSAPRSTNRKIFSYIDSTEQ